MVVYKPLGNTDLKAFQSLVTLDNNNISILFDAGWDQLLSQSVLSDLKSEISNIDLILITHSSLSHCGAFVYLRHNFPEFRKIPVYATFPTVKLAQAMTQDVYRSQGISGPFDDEKCIQFAEIEEIWSEVNLLNYSQPISLHNHPNLECLQITAYNAGHSLGGTLWKVEDKIDSIVFALDWNHARDAHLSGAFLEPKTGKVIKELQSPSLLITSSSLSSSQSVKKNREEFLAKIEEGLAQGGTILIPTSTGSRCLELILVLDSFINSHRNVPLIFCSYAGQQAVHMASSMLEWMVPSIITEWHVQNKSPFETNHVNYIHSVDQLKTNWTKGPRIVLASGECLESGLSKQVFVDIVAEDPKSTIIFTEYAPPGTLAADIMAEIENKNGLSRLTTELKKIKLQVEVPLSGKALKTYEKKLDLARERAELLAAQERRNQELIDTSAVAQAQEDSSESEDELEAGDLVNGGVNALLNNTDVYDVVVSEDDNTVFPLSAKRRKRDEYGEQLAPEFYTELNEKAKSKSQQPESESAAKSAEANPPPPTKVIIPTYKPMKISKKTKSLKPLCWTSYVDMNGFTNERSMEMILKQVLPQKICLIPSLDNPTDFEKLIANLSHQFPNFKVANQEIVYPRTNFSVELKIDPALQLQWHNLSKEYSVARVNGKLEFSQTNQINSLAQLVPNDESTAANTEQSLTIGDLRLTVVRKALAEKGINVEFKTKNVLSYEDKIHIKQLDNDTFMLEGGLEPDYYEIRQVIRSFITTI